jgi:predicted RNA binding protein YcfA (HicA-like mRNA interferase family)
MRTKDYSFKEFDKILRNNGFEFKSSKGDHFKYVRDNDQIIITRRNPNKMVMRRLIKEHNLTV